MSDTTDTTDTAAVVRSWAQDWAEEFDQSWDEGMLETYVGHRVVGALEREGVPPRRFVRNIIGYTKMVVWVLGEEGEDESTVERWGLIDDEGNMLSIYADMELRILAPGEDEGE